MEQTPYRVRIPVAQCKNANKERMATLEYKNLIIDSPEKISRTEAIDFKGKESVDYLARLICGFSRFRLWTKHRSWLRSGRTARLTLQAEFKACNFTYPKTCLFHLRCKRCSICFSIHSLLQNYVSCIGYRRRLFGQRICECPS